MTQEELAERLRVTQSTISRLETGESPWDGPVALLLEKLDEETPATAFASPEQHEGREQAA